MPRYTYDEPEEKKYTLLKPGEHDFTIAELSAFEFSSGGNEMLPIKLAIKHLGETVLIYDNLVFMDKAKFRIDQLLKSIGRAPAPGTAVDFDDPRWLIGLKGRCRVKNETNPKNGLLTNKIDNYVFTPGTVEGRTVTGVSRAPANISAQGTPTPDDNIPF